MPTRARQLHDVQVGIIDVALVDGDAPGHPRQLSIVSFMRLVQPQEG